MICTAIRYSIVAALIAYGHWAIALLVFAVLTAGQVALDEAVKRHYGI